MITFYKSEPLVPLKLTKYSLKLSVDFGEGCSLYKVVIAVSFPKLKTYQKLLLDIENVGIYLYKMNLESYPICGTDTETICRKSFLDDSGDQKHPRI